jgi:hypothetical protein
LISVVSLIVDPVNNVERTLGGLDVFLPYVRNYVDTFMGKSITTDQWKDHLYAYFEKNGGEEKVKALNTVDWQVSNPVLHPTWFMLTTLNKAWLYGGGLDLPVKIEYDLTLAKKAYELADRWDAARTVEDISKLNFTELDLQDVSSTQICTFSSPQSSCTIFDIYMAYSRIPRTSSNFPTSPITTSSPPRHRIQVLHINKRRNQIPVLPSCPR